MVKPPSRIGVMREMSLHAALKSWYAQPGDTLETRVDGYVVDIVRDEGALLIEIQTGNFSSMRSKLAALMRNHRVRLVYPVAAEKWIVRLAPDEQTELSRRRSPRRGQTLDVFRELPGIARFVADPNFSIEVLLVRAEEVLCPANGRRASWRRKGWRILDRRLIDVVGRHTLETPNDFRALLPAEGSGQPAATGRALRETGARYSAGIPVADTRETRTFTTRDLAGALGISRFFAQKIAYCLRQMGAIDVAGRQGNTLVYRA